ncbi:EscU/YscU/HrcU family type III secretion system export apparatus switch protein [Candidatus Sneabacter namystus]|uniref:EscU/YscU/HrcU family type III secretion system export apparatus switch protein n=1 Tax=Candidatus Sneabacter namystus TaxID=2601646 RepID=A0A5C0UKS5_9RICK|nr:EscU/YscU/HrcU family type III secretion system export apparatus switch protein [Candidatus Sneabacter namystus]QEK39454.1 EscU/YscU/HrcU family type III secretion system export apparatus switch protein [Candidatus Sneabacter namystus]
MVQSSEDQAAKTEEPTERKVQEAFKKGNLMFVKDVYSVCIMTAWTVSVIFIIPDIVKGILNYMCGLLTHAGNLSFSCGPGVSVGTLFLKVLLYMTPLFIFIIASIILANFLHHFKFYFSFNSVKLDFSKISIASGLSKILSKKNLLDFVANLIKLLLLIVVFTVSVFKFWNTIINYSLLPLHVIMQNIFSQLHFFFILSSVVVGCVACFSYFYSRKIYFNKLKMTRQEIKRELRETEGDHEIKKRIRYRVVQRWQSQLANAVPKADVIVTNPEHFAVALSYNSEVANVPKVTAKGKDMMALRMKYIAKKNNVPIVPNKQLAQGLYKEVAVQGAIPPKYYTIVAEILSFVISMKNSK